MARGYYVEGLAAGRLERVYDLAGPAVRRYLDAEIAHLRSRLSPADRVLELGCGYGRILEAIAPHVRLACGVDSSAASLHHWRARLAELGNVVLSCADAAAPALAPGAFDVVCCLQNGVSAFKIEPARLFRAALAAARPGGRVIFSTYAAAFWETRLDWFRAQAAAGLLGEIDEAATGDGVIVCRDGFRAVTPGPDELRGWAADCGREARLTTVADSSLFCELIA